jgi:prepilin-type N-terminal cleavage/methylation domain-containing protein
MRKGFTMIELLTVMALIVVIGIITYANVGGFKNAKDLTATTQQAATLLRQAQTDAMNQESDAPWGVYFANSTGTPPFYALFTTSYGTGTIVSGPYPLPSTVVYTTSTLAVGATTSVIFSPISGMSSASTSIGFRMLQNATLSSTIRIASSGEVSF